MVGLSVVEVDRSLPPGSKMVILIHGYANDEQGAAGSYSAFLDSSRLDTMAVVGDVCEFYWPGDGRALKAASYPFEIKSARESAERLAEFLRRRPTPGGWPLEIVLICHSLGNRVVLEMLDVFVRGLAPANVRFRGVCLMAAAVSTNMVELGGPLRHAAELVERTLVMFSHGDAVLHFAFPGGQTAALEGFFPRAIGRFGEPVRGLWTERLRTPHGHSDYWTHHTTSDVIKAFLGLAHAREVSSVGLEFRNLAGNVLHINTLLSRKL
jgi:hypothetical protein